MTDQNEIRTPEEIEALKKNWLQDPCWDIEDTEGFEAHREELLTWRKEYQAKREQIREAKDQRRIEKVMLATGIGKADRELLLALWTFEEIEYSARNIERITENPDVLISATMVRATLLQAAQLKRIADALETLADQDDNSLLSAYKIWGMK